MNNIEGRRGTYKKRSGFMPSPEFNVVVLLIKKGRALEPGECCRFVRQLKNVIETAKETALVQSNEKWTSPNYPKG